MALTKVVFYQLEDTSEVVDAEEVYSFALILEILQQSYRINQRVFIHCQEQQQMHYLDELIWSYEGNHFLAHSIEGESSCNKSPIVLGTHYPDKMGSFAMVLNLSEVPLFDFERLQQITEIVPSASHEKQQAREKFKQYAQKGFQPVFQTMKLSEINKVAHES